MGTILKEKEAFSWLILVYCKPMSFFFLINYSLSKHGLHNLLKAYLPLFFRTFFLFVFRLSFVNLSLTCQPFVHFFRSTIVPFSDCHLPIWLVNFLFIFFLPQLYHFEKFSFSSIKILCPHGRIIVNFISCLLWWFSLCLWLIKYGGFY